MKLDCKYFNQVDEINLNMALFSFLLCAIHLVTGKKITTEILTELRNICTVKPAESMMYHMCTFWIYFFFFHFISYQNRFGKFSMVNDRYFLTDFPLFNFCKKENSSESRYFFSMCIISVAIELKKNNFAIVRLYSGASKYLCVLEQKSLCVCKSVTQNSIFFFSMC